MSLSGCLYHFQLQIFQLVDLLQCSPSFPTILFSPPPTTPTVYSCRAIWRRSRKLRVKVGHGSALLSMSPFWLLTLYPLPFALASLFWPLDRSVTSICTQQLNLWIEKQLPFKRNAGIENNNNVDIPLGPDHLQNVPFVASNPILTHHQLQKIKVRQKQQISPQRKRPKRPYLQTGSDKTHAMGLTRPTPESGETHGGVSPDPGMGGEDRSRQAPANGIVAPPLLPWFSLSSAGDPAA